MAPATEQDRLSALTKAERWLPRVLNHRTGPWNQVLEARDPMNESSPVGRVGATGSAGCPSWCVEHDDGEGDPEDASYRGARA